MKLIMGTKSAVVFLALLAISALSGCQSIGSLREDIVHFATKAMDGLSSAVKPDAQAEADSQSAQAQALERSSAQAASHAEHAPLPHEGDRPESPPLAPQDEDVTDASQDEPSTHPHAPSAPGVEDQLTLCLSPATPDSVRDTKPGAEALCRQPPLPQDRQELNNPPLPPVQAQARVVIRSKNAVMDPENSIKVVLGTTIPDSGESDLTLRITGTSPRETVFRKSVVLRKPYRSSYTLKTTVLTTQESERQRVLVVAELIDPYGQPFAVAKEEIVVRKADAATCCKSPQKEVGRTPEQLLAALTARALDGCGNPDSFDKYVGTLNTEDAQLVADTIGRLKDALNAYSAILTKAADNRDTYEDYRRYSTKFPHSPCASVARRGTTVSFWMSRNTGSQRVLAQLDSAIIASMNPSEIEIGEAHFQSLREQGNPYARLREAKRLYGAGRTQDAERLLLELERTAPSAEVFEHLGYINTSDCKKSSDYFSRALKFDANCAPCYFHRAECLDTFGRHGDAKEGFRKTLELTKGHKDTRSVRYYERSKRRLEIN